MENAPHKKEKWKKWTPSPLTLILLGLIAYLWFRPPADVSDENRPAPPWQVTLPDGRLLTSESLKGRVVLVNFWATWCPYCRKEKPVIDEYWKDNRARGFEVIAISIDDTPEQIAEWAHKTGYTFMAAPTNGSVAAAFGAVGSVPTSFILDRDGRIRHKVAGQLHSARLKKTGGTAVGVARTATPKPSCFSPLPRKRGRGRGISSDWVAVFWQPCRSLSSFIRGAFGWMTYLGVCNLTSLSDGTTNHSTKPASGQVAGYPQPSPACGRGRYSEGQLK